MKSDQDILREFQEFKNGYLESADWWLKNEVKDNYSAVEGIPFGENESGQWEEGALDRRVFDDLPVITINKLAPVVDAIAGFQIQHSSRPSYSPRTLGLVCRYAVDKVNDGIEYLYTDSHAEHEKSFAVKDCLTCGLGATDTEISYDENPYGEVENRRIAPYMVGFDTAARKKNLVDANRVYAAKLVKRDAYIEEVNQDRPKKDHIIEIGGIDDAMLGFLSRNIGQDELGVEYNYQWREKEPFYQVKNTLMQAITILVQDPVAIDVIKFIQEEYDFDAQKDTVFNIDPKQYKECEKYFVALGAEFKATKHRTYRYYRAIIAGETLIEKSENYSQKGFSIKFITGKWSETRQCFYGVVRGGKEAQRLLNKGVSDYAELMFTSPHGGMIIEADAVDDIEEFAANITAARKLTIVNSGAIAQGKLMLKPTPPAPQAVIGLIQFAERSILEAMGVNQAFMGMGDHVSNDHDLNGQRVLQGLSTLAEFFQSITFYTIEQGKLYVDCLGVLAENTGGLIIRNTSRHPNQQGQIDQYIELLQDDIAKEYDIIVKEVPKTPNEKEKLVTTLLDLAQMITGAGGNGQGLLPQILDNLDMPAEDIDKTKEATQPPPPQQPDPVQQELIQSQSVLNRSIAKLNDARASNTNLDMLHQHIENQAAPERAAAETEEIKSKIMLNVSKAAETGVKAVKIE